MSHSHITPNQKNELSVLLRAGLKQKDIAKLLNKTPSAICQELKETQLIQKQGIALELQKTT